MFCKRMDFDHSEGHTILHCDKEASRLYAELFLLYCRLNILLDFESYNLLCYILLCVEDILHICKLIYFT